MRADLVRAPDDRLDVLDLGLLEEDVADRDEQRPLVDPLDESPVVLAHDDLEIRLRLVQVANGREVRRARRRPGCAVASTWRKHESATASAIATFWCMTVDPGGRADDPPDLVSDPDQGVSHQPSAHERMPRSAHMRAYSASRSAAPRGIAPSEWLDEVRRLLEDRELGPVLR